MTTPAQKLEQRRTIQVMYMQFRRLGGTIKKTSTGFGMGRPRNGELRPTTPGAEEQKKIRAKHKDSAEYKQIQAMYHQFWHLANREKSLQIRRDSARRKASWKNAEGKFSK